MTTSHGECECCGVELTSFPGPVLREKMAMVNAQPGECFRLPWVCSVECFEVELAAYYFQLEPCTDDCDPDCDPDRFAHSMVDAVDAMRYAFKNMGTSSKLAAKALRKFGASL